MNTKPVHATSRASAADRLLDREVSDDYLREWTEHVAREKKSLEPGTRSVVIFRIASEWLALPTRILQEVVERCTLHKLPGTGRELVCGLVNVRGELLLCVSLERVLGIGVAPAQSPQAGGASFRRFIVCNRSSDRLVFPVDEIAGLTLYRPRELREVPSTLSRAAATYVAGILLWSGKSVACLDDELLFYALNKGLS